MSLTWGYYYFKATLRWWGRRSGACRRLRWAIEGFFKVAKHRFGLHRFGQSSPLGVYRWLVLVLIAFVLALGGLLMQQTVEKVDWAVASQTIVRLVIPHIVIYSLRIELEPWRREALQLGIELPELR